MKLKQVPLELINSMNHNTLMEVLDIQFVEIGDDYVLAKMPVNNSTKQPMGLLHGGASAALIESIGSMASCLLVDVDKYNPVGVEVNANHVRGVSEGNVIARGKIMHAGTKTHVWQVDITEEATGNLLCTGRLTVMIVPKS